MFDASDDECDSTKSEDDDESEPNHGPYVFNKLPVASSSESVVEEAKCIAFSSCIKELAQTSVPLVCPRKDCSATVTSTTKQKGTALRVTWVRV